MGKAFFLGMLLGIGVPPLVQFVWDKSWGYLESGNMSVNEAELIRFGVSLLLVVIVGLLLRDWGKKDRENNLKDIEKVVRNVFKEQNSSTGAPNVVKSEKSRRC